MTALATATPAPALRWRSRYAALRRIARNGEEELRTALGALARGLRLEAAAAPTPLFVRREVAFRSYPTLHPGACATVVTPPDGAYLHTFFDVPPISPSGRYLAVTRLPFQHRGPYPGDTAEVCVIDLAERTIETVYHTRGWALQLGANLHWHPGRDDLLYCNDRIGGRGLGVVIDLSERRARPLGGPVYSLCPRGRHAFGPALDLINATQAGYGVPDPFLGRRRPTTGFATDEGIWRTDLESGRCELLVSVDALLADHPERALLASGRHSLFHTKVNGTGDRLFQVVRSTGLADAPEKVRAMILTLSAEGDAVRLALPHRLWDRGGHHPSWTPDDETILMNLVPPGGHEMRFVRFGHDGNGLAELVGGFRGSGHPSLDPTGRLLLTDAYLNEGYGDANGRAPVRLVDLAAGKESQLMLVDSGPPGLKARRVDPHPVWDRKRRRIVLNVMLEQKRQVVLVDLGGSD
jgi:hypothetical protein